VNIEELPNQSFTNRARGEVFWGDIDDEVDWQESADGQSFVEQARTSEDTFRSAMVPCILFWINICGWLMKSTLIRQLFLHSGP
jgi:hypothetical protein